MISKTVLSKGLDVGTAYEILSIDIADIDVGNNVGAKLAMDEADAEKLCLKQKRKSEEQWLKQMNKKCEQEKKK